jgi:NAD(P)-dependent dehydrogenase (short-subunit alcohol dehydrogenase family)
MMGVNHLGHFYFTFLLWDRIKEAQKPRIINLSSSVHRGFGKLKNNAVIDFKDFNFINNFTWQLAYARSKIANILFTNLLQRKMDEIGL